MKKIEQAGKKLSRNETKKIQGGGPMYGYYCWVDNVCYCAKSCPAPCGGNCTQVYWEGWSTCAQICGS